MPVVALRCPHCNGDVQLDDKKEFGFCCNCGTKIMIQEQIKQRYSIDNSEKIKNWIDLSQSALLSKNYLESKKYADMVISEDSGSQLAWFLKMCCVLSTESLMDEAIFCSERCRGIEGTDLSQFRTVLTDSLLYRFSSSEIDKIMGTEGTKIWYLSNIYDYQEKVYRIFSNLVKNPITKEKTSFWIDYVKRLLESLPSLGRVITRVACLQVAVASLRLFRDLRKTVYISEKQIIDILEHLVVASKKANKGSDVAYTYSSISLTIDINTNSKSILQIYEQACGGLTDEEDYLAWEYLLSRGDKYGELLDSLYDNFESFSVANVKLTGGKKAAQSKIAIMDLFERIHHPKKYYV